MAATALASPLLYAATNFRCNSRIAFSSAGFPLGWSAQLGAVASRTMTVAVHLMGSPPFGGEKWGPKMARFALGSYLPRAPTCFTAPSYQRSETEMLPSDPDATVMTFPLSVVNLISEDKKWLWKVNRSAYCGASIKSRGLLTPRALSSLLLSRIACRSAASEGFVTAAKPTRDMPRMRNRRILPHTGRPLRRPLPPPVLP